MSTRDDTPILPTEAVLVTRGVLQPFQCPECLKRFTRHENLKRHSALHRPEEVSSYGCQHCTATFSRRDLRRRHMARKHPDVLSNSPKSSTPPSVGATAPAAPPEDLYELSNIFEPLPTLPTPESSVKFDFELPPLVHVPPAKGIAGLLTPDQVSHGVNLFFQHCIHLCPFIHRPTFDVSTTAEPVLLGMLCISLQYDAAVQELSSRCFELGKTLLADDGPYRDIPPLGIIQGLVLLEIYAIMYACGPLTAFGLRIHARCVEIARREELMGALSSRAATNDLESLWRQFVRNETHKRTLFCVFTIDATWYHLLSMPRSMSHLEIKHEMPCSEPMWSAANSGEWAHRSLLSGKEKEGVKYIQATRAWMSPLPIPPTPPASSYGSLLLILFLHTGVREVSGWSTMTGKICFERFEALHASLLALEPLICKPSDDPYAIEAEATWRITMIELLLWNPSHTSGLVEASLDAAIASAMHLSVTQSGVFTPHVAELLGPHVVWFLHFLARTSSNPTEAPWVTVYAFKAVLVALQLVRAGMVDALNSLGLSDENALSEWAKTAFERRAGVGRLVLKNMEERD